MDNKKILSIVMFVILLASSFTFLGAFTFFPVQKAEAQGLQLRVSAAQNPAFQNHFFGPQIIQMIIDDPGATDPVDSTVGLQLKGFTAPRIHLQDGLWYSFFAEQATFLLFLDVMTDGVRDNAIFVANPAGGMDAANPVGIGAIPGAFTQVPGNTDSFVSEITVVGGANVFVELDQNDIFPTLPTAFCDGPSLGAPCPAANVNPDLDITGDGAEDSVGPNTNIQTRAGAPFAGFATNRGDVDFPYIELTGINENDQVNIRAGSASVNLNFKDFRDSISSVIDRKTDYPLNAEMIISYTDFMYNINPVEEDTVIFALNGAAGSAAATFGGAGTPAAVIYNPIRNFDPRATGLIQGAPLGRNIPNLLPVLFRPNLLFDTRQLLEVDLEGVQTLAFTDRLDLGANGQLDTSFATSDDTFAAFFPGQPRIAQNAFGIANAAFANRLPVIQMTESDPNTSFFESIDEQQGSRSDIFGVVNDRVASFDYFDIINSAPMTTHDGFSTVDREVYNSADRAVFTVTDSDQNLRSRVAEEPSAIRSNTGVKLGSPFPIGNNPTFATFFGKNTLPTATGAADILPNLFDFETCGGTADVYGVRLPGPDAILCTGDDIVGGDGLLGTADDVITLGVANTRQGIEQAEFILGFDADDVTSAACVPAVGPPTVGGNAACAPNGIADATDAATAAQVRAGAENELNTGTLGATARVSVFATGFGVTSLGAGEDGIAANADDGPAFPAGTVAGAIRIDIMPGSRAGSDAAEVVLEDIGAQAGDAVATSRGNNGLIERNGNINTGEAVLLATSGDVAEAISPAGDSRGQTFGLNFNTGTIGVDRPSGIVLNTNVNLQDLNQFTQFTATGAQITSNGIAAPIAPLPSGQAFLIDPLVAATAMWSTTLTGTPTAGTTFTHAGANVNNGLGLGAGAAAGTVFRVFQPQYNLVNLDLSELNTASELVTNDNFNVVAVQIKVDDGQTGSNANGQLRDTVTRLVDFTPFQTNDVSLVAGNFFTPDLLGATKVGPGSFRLVDFLAQDWDDDGLFFPTDTNEPFTTLNVQISIVFIDRNAVIDASQNEPAEVIVPGTHFAATDIGGIAIVIPPPVVAGGISSFPATRTIDEVNLLASQNFVYRIQVKEQGSNSSIFTGRLDFETVNQLDTTQRALADIVASGDPAKAFMPNRFIPPNRLAFAYTDVDIVQVFRPTSASFIYETVDGDVKWDRSSYSFGQDAFLTITDEDLNKKPDATERYNLPQAGMFFFELGKQRIADATSALQAGGLVIGNVPFGGAARPCDPTQAVNVAFIFNTCFLAEIDASLLETGPNTGTFVSQISMPNFILLASNSGADTIQGTADDILALQQVQQQDLEANYEDVRDRSSIKQEFDDITNIRTTLGDVVLDRAAYPPGAIMYVEIHDNDFNTDVDIRESINLNQIVISSGTANTANTALTGYLPNAPTLGTQISAVTPNPALGTCITLNAFVGTTCGGATPSSGAAPIVEINVFNTGRQVPTVSPRLVTLLPAGFLDLAANGATGQNVANAAQRFGTGITTGNPAALSNVLPILDRNGNVVTSATETGPNTGIFEFEVRLPGPSFSASAFPVTLPTVLTAGSVTNPVINANLPIQVTYEDPADESGKAEDVQELATFLFNTARLRTDKLEYGLGQPVDVIVEEPDFNLDSRAIDQAAFSILDVVTDKFDTEDNDATNLQTVLNGLPQLRLNQTVLRESGLNSGVFVVQFEELVEQFADRGEDVKLIYQDQTPSGGGTTIRVEYDFTIVAILPEIVFDKEEYTPFDEFTISIISPDSNQDPDRIETIRPIISSSSGSLGRVSLPETGPNTGIFEDNFDLTPNPAQFPGDLLAIREDGVTVEFRIDENTVASKSVFVNYHVGQVMFDKDAFRINERGVLRVIDPDANRNPNTIDTLQTRFWSTTDRGGLLVTLRETGDRTGIFEEIITFTPDEESSGTRLRVSEGDTITSKYTDNTLPAPAALGNDQVFTVEVEELFASALIGSVVEPLARAVASEPELVDQTGGKLTDITVGSQVLVQSEITNSQTKKQPFAYIVQIKDDNGVTISLSWVTGELPAKESLKAAQSWIPDVAGNFTVEIFVWESVDKPNALSPVRTTTVSVR